MKKYKVTVDGKTYEVELEEIVTTEKAGAVSENSPSLQPKTVTQPTSIPKKQKSSQKTGQNNVVAPMSGKILKVAVQVGQEVFAGQVVLILEAMKMENEIYAQKAGKIKSIRVKEEQTVNPGDVLMEIE